MLFVIVVACIQFRGSASQESFQPQPMSECTGRAISIFFLQISNAPLRVESEKNHTKNKFVAQKPGKVFMFDVLGEKKNPKGNIIFQNVLLVFQLDLF